MTGTQHHDFRVSVGLYQTSVEATGIAEADMWYNFPEGRPKVRLNGRTGILGPHGTHPLVYNASNTWYPLQPGGVATTALTTVNNRAYAFPFTPGRKCFLDKFGLMVVTPGVGNIRAAVYSSDNIAGLGALPHFLVSDFGTHTAATAANETVTSFNLDPGTGLPIEPYAYWIVIAMQTSVAPTTSAYNTFNPAVPWPISTPTFGTSDYINCLYYDSGFAGPSIPETISGPPDGATLGPLVYTRLSTTS